MRDAYQYQSLATAHSMIFIATLNVHSGGVAFLSDNIKWVTKCVLRKESSPAARMFISEHSSLNN